MRAVLVTAGAGGLAVVAFVLLTRLGPLLAGHPAYAVAVSVLAVVSALALVLGLRRSGQR
jgi:hypothetical protein